MEEVSDGSPRTGRTEITHLSWGRMEVTIDGQKQTFKDCKVWPGGAEAWDWRLTGTRHRPGTQPADVAGVLDQGIEVMVLSQGMERRLQIQPQTEALLRGRDIEYHIEETTRAVALFNELSREGVRVGGIFHSTC